MSSITLAFGSDRADRVTTLAALPVGARGVVVEVDASNAERSDRLLSLGVTPGARVSVLQTFPGVVFQCDQTELAAECSVARSVIVETCSHQSQVSSRQSQVASRQA